MGPGADEVEVARDRRGRRKRVTRVPASRGFVAEVGSSWPGTTAFLRRAGTRTRSGVVSPRRLRTVGTRRDAGESLCRRPGLARRPGTRIDSAGSSSSRPSCGDVTTSAQSYAPLSLIILSSGSPDGDGLGEAFGAQLPSDKQPRAMEPGLHCALVQPHDL